MKVQHFNLSEAEMTKVLKDLKSQKKKSTIILEQKHLSSTGKHQLLLNSENSKKIQESFSKKKKIPIILHITTGGNLDKSKITGGFIPIILAGIGAVSGIIGAIATASTAIKDWKHKNVEEAETHRHNVEMEKRLKNVKTVVIGKGVCKKKKYPR